MSIWIIALAVFMFGIWQQPFIGFETRFAVFAQEMLRNGPTLFPTTYGQPYPDYPGTSTLLIWLFSLPFGEVTKFTAVLPTALASATIVALTYMLFAQYSKKWGVLAVAMELLTFTFVGESRSISVDQMVSAVTLSAFYLTHRSYREGSALPAQWLMLLLVAGFLIRGPIGVVIPAGVILSHLALTGGRRDVIVFAARSAVVLLACLLVALGLVLLIYGDGFLGDIVRMQAVGRFADTAPSPRYYYFTGSVGNYALSYPIAAVFAVGLLIGRIRRRSFIDSKEHGVMLMLLLAWTGIVLVGMSIPETKKVRYVISVVPPLAGLASYALICGEQGFTKWLRRCVEWILLSLPLLAGIVLVAQRTRLADAGINLKPCLAVFLALFAASVAVLYRRWKRQTDDPVPVCVVGVLTSLIFQIAVVEPVDLYLHDTSAFVRRIEALRQQRPGNVAFYRENPDGLPIKYLVNARMDYLPRFISSPEDLKTNQAPIWLVAKEKHLDELIRTGIVDARVILREKFGELPYLAAYIPPRASP